MGGFTNHYNLKKLNVGDHLSDDSYKFTDADRDAIDLLIYLAGESHHHTGGAAAGIGTPTAGPTMSLLGSSGALPAGRRIYYRFTYVSATGIETGPSPEVFIDTPSQVASPGKPTLVSASTGGALNPGNYYYVLSAYTDSSIYETPAVNPETILVSGSTATNTVTLTLPALPTGASGFNIYRQAPGGPGYFFITSVDMTVATPPTTWVDSGAQAPNCDRTRPTVNTTRQTNSVFLTIPGATPTLAPGQSWRIYRTYTSGDYTNSLLVTATAVTYTDTGTATTAGQPPLGEVSVGSPAQVLLTDFAEAQGRLPMAGVSAFPEVVSFSFDGDLVPLTGTSVWTCEFPNATIVGVRAALGRGATPASTPLIIDVNTGSGPNPTFSSIFTLLADQPTIAVGVQRGDRVAPTAVTELLEGDMLTVDIDQAGGGSTPTDRDLVVNVYLYAYGWTDPTSHSAP